MKKLMICAGLLLMLAACSAPKGAKESAEPETTRIDADTETRKAEPKPEEGSNLNDYERSIEDLFYGLPDDDRVLKLPDGGMLTGPGGVIEVTDEDGNVIESYDLTNDPNSMSVKEARQKYKK